MARADWQYVNGSTNNNSVFFTGIRWRYRDDLYGTTGYPSDRTTSNIDIIEYQPFSGRKQSYNTFSYTSWKTSYYRYSYNTVSGQEPDTASNTLNISTTFRFDKATNNTKYYPVKGSLSSANVFNISSNDTSRIIQVPHCSDGTSKVRLFFHYTGDSNTAFSYGETNAVITLETIPRASSITVNDANIGSSTNIVINKASGSFTTTLSYKASGQNDWTTIVTKTPNQVYGWVVPTSFYSLIPNSKTISCEIKADTYSDDTLVGTKTATATFTATGNPVINSSSAVDTNSTTIALTGNNANMVKYASNVQVSVSVSGQNSASVSSVTINGSNVSLSGTNPKTGSTTFNGATTNSFEIKVTDSRGYQTTTTHTMTMVDYVPLTINATIKRNQPTDEKVNINASGNYFNASFGSQSNTLSVQYRYKESTSSSWGNWTNLSVTTSGNTYSGSTQLSNMDYTKSYNFEIKATDKVGTKSITGITVTKGTPVYWWDNDEFHINGNSYVNGNNVISGDLFSNEVDMFSDTSGNGWQEMLRNKIDYCIANVNTNKQNGTYFINGGWAGVRYGFGVYSKIGTWNQLVWFSNLGTYYVSKDLNNNSYDYNRNGRNVVGEILPSNNLNDFRTDGKYVYDNGSQNYSNCPTSDGIHILNVSSNGGTDWVIQEDYVLRWNASYVEKYIRQYSPPGWSAWQKVIETTTTGTGVVTRSSGANLTGSSYAKYGNVVTLSVECRSTSATNVGNNLFTGTLNNSALYPKVNAGGTSYSASSGLIGFIDTSGNITVRVVGSQLATNRDANIVFTYVV